MRPLIQSLLLAAFTLLSLTALSAERTTYYIPDAQGSPVAAMDEYGNLLWRESYAPYGERRQRAASNDASNTYAGKPESLDTSFIYMGARWYDPESARFTGIDPQGFVEGDPQSFGRYTYAANSPYRYVDPNGESPIDVVFLAYDAVKFVQAVNSGDSGSIKSAGTDLAISALGMLSPVPGSGQAIKAAKAADKVANPVSGTLARVIPAHVDPKTLGNPNDADVFVTNASELQGLSASQIADRITIPLAPEGFKIIEFPSSAVDGVASPINRSNPGFIGKGKTAGGAAEFVIPNGPLPKGSTQRIVK